MSALMSGYQRGARFLQDFFLSFILLACRLTLAKVFLQSGLTKWNGFLEFNPDKYDLFLYEFFCPDPIRPGALLLCDPVLLDYDPDSWVVPFVQGLAITAGTMEIVLPILLIFGLFSRLAAMGLLLMAAFIQLAVFPSADHWWSVASWWVLTASVLIAIGPGRWSIDRIFKLEKSHF